MQPADEPFRLREAWPTGTVIKDDYVIERRLAGGGFGTVYLASHKFLGTTHVIKKLHDHFASDVEFVRKFINEGRAIRRLKACPNIVEVEHMTQTADGHLILIMEHISGGDLAGLMESRVLSVGEVIEYGRQIAVALDAAHQAGLVHRDIKPQNVLISHDSTARTLLKLIDFGIAADHSSQHQTSVMRGGSVGYAAPEQWIRAGRQLDGRTDLYSLGATLYRLLTGRMPYPDATDIGDWIEKVKQGPPIPPDRLRPDIPAALNALIVEMLQPRPESRPASAASVIASLTAMQTVHDLPAPIAAAAQRELTQVLDRPPAVVPPPASGGSGMRWAAFSAGGIVVVAALALSIWKLMPEGILSSPSSQAARSNGAGSPPTSGSKAAPPVVEPLPKPVAPPLEQAKPEGTPSPSSSPVPSQARPVEQAAKTNGAPARIRVGSDVQGAILIRKVAPVYPPLAIKARIQGTVRYTAVIGKDGVVQSLQLVSGNPLLVPAAGDALKQWVYKPTLVNGKPVEVTTEIDVNFTLKGVAPEPAATPAVQAPPPESKPEVKPADPPKAAPTPVPTPPPAVSDSKVRVEQVYTIGGDVTAPKVVSKIEPDYSQEASKARLQGVVVLGFVVDEHGYPRDLRVIRPLGLGLDQKAMEAVGKWRFSPGEKAGKPVATQVTIQVTFRLMQ